MTKKNEEEERIKELISTGSEITGSVTGSVLGAIIAGVPGAILGGASGPIIAKLFKKIGLEIKQRVLGDREEARIGATYIYALEKIEENLKGGKKLREDDFFDSKGDKRPASEEILEGALLKAQKEHEEIKIKHYGFLVGNISFNENLDRGRANFLLRTTERLSYRQLCLIELFNDSNKFELFKKFVVPDDNVYNARDIISALSTINKNRFLSIKLPLKDRKADLDAELVELDALRIIELENRSYEMYNRVKLTDNGKVLRELLELDKLSYADIEEIAKILRFEEKSPNDLSY